jgi:hypothetical protein
LWNVVAAVVLLVAGALWFYEWLVFPDAGTRKALQLTGTGLFGAAMLILAVSKRRPRRLN